MIDRSRQFRKTVSALNTNNDDVVVPNGKTWRFQGFFGSADYSSLTRVEVLFDPGGASEQILFSTYGTANHHTDTSVVGDGVKKVRIRLKNDSTVSVALLCEYLAVEED